MSHNATPGIRHWTEGPRARTDALGELGPDDERCV
jgi:hypothetical protein